MNRLKEVREKRKVDFSQYHLAALCGIPQTRISLLERGLVKPSQVEIEKITKVFNCTKDDIFPEL